MFPCLLVLWTIVALALEGLLISEYLSPLTYDAERVTNHGNAEVRQGLIHDKFAPSLGDTLVPRPQAHEQYEQVAHHPE